MLDTIVFALLTENHQTANNAEFPVLQVRAVDAAGFEVASFQQLTSSSTGSNETAAYLAIYSPGNSGTVRIADSDQSYRLQRELLDGTWTAVLDTVLRRQDGVSADEQIGAETHDVFALGTHVFAQQLMAGTSVPWCSPMDSLCSLVMVQAAMH